jgi:hypothetical protein
MPLPFDATLKDLAQVNPRGLLAAFDVVTTLPVSLLNIDLSTVTTSADLVFGLGQPLQEIVHLDFQSSASATKHADILVYNALLYRQHLVPVHSIVVLLRSQAAHPNLHGLIAYAPRNQRGKMDYRYEVVRIWERRSNDFLAGDLGMVPLAVLAGLPPGIDSETALAGIIQQVVERLQREAAPEQLRRLLTASFVLTGLRIPRERARHLFQGVQAMRDSDTFMSIIDEGRLEEVKKVVLRLGQKKLGVADETVRAFVAGNEDVDHLEFLLERILDVKSWQELLATP